MTSKPDGAAAPLTAGGSISFWKNPLATPRSRIATFFLLYVSEGIPLGFTATLIATQMRRHGLDPVAIGAFVGSLYLPWAFKWAFGPIVDTVTSVRFGRRRTWIVASQLGMMVTLLAALPIDFVDQITLFTAVIFAHNVCAATQDVGIDALAVQVLHPDERGTANGFMFAGQTLGQVIGGPVMLLTLSWLSLHAAFVVVVALMGLLLVCVSWRLREPAMAQSEWSAAAQDTQAALQRIAREIAAFVRAAARAFVGTRAAALGVLFALLPLGAMSLSLALGSNLAVEVGMSDDTIGEVGMVAGILSALGCIAGGWMSDRFGRRRMIALFAVSTAIPTLALAWAMQSAGHVMPVDVTAGAPGDAALIGKMIAAALVYATLAGLAQGSSIALYMDITTPAVAATQFTAYMALANLVATYSATWQGHTIVTFGYPTTLVIDACLGLISIVLLRWMGVRSSPSSQGTPGST